MIFFIKNNFFLFLIYLFKNNFFVFKKKVINFNLTVTNNLL